MSCSSMQIVPRKHYVDRPKSAVEQRYLKVTNCQFEEIKKFSENGQNHIEQRELERRQALIQDAEDNLQQAQEEQRKAQKKLDQAATEHDIAYGQFKQGVYKKAHNLDDLRKMLQDTENTRDFRLSQRISCNEKVQKAYKDLRAAKKQHFEQIKILEKRQSRRHAKEIHQRIKRTQRQLQQVEKQLKKLDEKLAINENRIKAEGQDKQTIAKWQKKQGFFQRKRKQLEETRQELIIQLKQLDQERP